MTCNPMRMLCHKHVNEMLGFLWITLTANSQKFVSLDLSERGFDGDARDPVAAVAK